MKRTFTILILSIFFMLNFTVNVYAVNWFLLGKSRGDGTQVYLDTESVTYTHNNTINLWLKFVLEAEENGIKEVKTNYEAIYTSPYKIKRVYEVWYDRNGQTIKGEPQNEDWDNVPPGSTWDYAIRKALQLAK